MSLPRDTTLMNWPSYPVLLSSVVALGLVLYSVLRFPASITTGGMAGFLAAIVGFVSYASAAIWLGHVKSRDTRLALRIGAVVGVAIASCAVTNHIVELWTTLPASIGAVLGGGMWGLMILGFGIACTTLLAGQRSLAFALLSSIWCAMTMAALLIVVALAIGVFFLPHMEKVLAEPFASSGMTDPAAFVVRHLISSASSHLFVAPSISLIVGVVSAAAFTVIAPVSRRSAILLACFAVLLFFGSVFALRHASSLPREDRPPFIDFGLVSLAVTLISAHPLVVAIRSGRRLFGFD